MKYFVIIIVVFALLGGIFLALPESKDSVQKLDTESVQNNNFATIQADIDNGSLLVDVRTPEEFESSHISGAVNLPLADIQAGTLPNSEKSQKLYIYCKSGNRSSQAEKLLEDSGYTNIVNLGAMTDVISLGGKEI